MLNMELDKVLNLISKVSAMLLLFSVKLVILTVCCLYIQIYVIDSADRKRMEETGLVSGLRSSVAKSNSLVSIVKNHKKCLLDHHDYYTNTTLSNIYAALSKQHNNNQQRIF